MSRYGDLFAHDRSVFQFRNEVYSEFLFSPKEFVLTSGYVNSPALLAAVRDDPNAYDLDSLNQLDIYLYKTTVEDMRERLDVLGFGKQLMSDVVSNCVSEEVSTIERLLHLPGNTDELRDHWKEQLSNLREFSYESWLEQIHNARQRPMTSQSEVLARGPFPHLQLDERAMSGYRPILRKAPATGPERAQ